MPRNIAKRARRKGQAIIEYCLLLAFMTLVFGSIFALLRRGVFVFWVCDLYPRVAALHSCTEVDECYESMGNPADVKVPVCP